MDKSIERMMQISIRCVNLRDYYTIPYPKSSRVEFNEPLPRDISLQEQRECICDGHSGSDVAGTRGGTEGVETGQSPHAGKVIM